MAQAKNSLTGPFAQNATTIVFPHFVGDARPRYSVEAAGLAITSGRSPHWVKVKPESAGCEAGSRRGLGPLRTVSRKAPITLKSEISAILASGEVGSLALTLDNKDVVRLLKAAVEREGSISAFAKRHGLGRTNLTNMLNGKRPVSASLVEAFGLQRVYVPKKGNR